ncbi:Trap dicarboxylate transporter, dctm subunit [uncultured delta proteobacterium]|uniref:Trap dicarboxylate transporter, dctm subunit n=1 Tax=uncultured delta proteobacterium TaxID=34034 RepID=A0A212JIB9_9DELT|nr:Trap dicarboxylate transporter, dctm subunit [uncultured delta proteobacterium]
MIFKDPVFWTLALFLVPLVVRVPIAVALGTATIAVVWFWDMGYQMLSYSFYAGISKTPLLAIPFFILAGIIMEKVGIAERIIALIKQIVGDITGGLAIATVVVAAFWGAVSGSGPATVAALGLILIPSMAKAGYDKPFAAATVSVSSGLAIIIPPSIAFIVYADIMQESVGAMFAAGILPGILIASCLAIAVYIVSRIKGYRGEKRGTPAQIWAAFYDALWGLATPGIILGGIYGGIFTPTEAAAVATFYGLFVGILVYRTLTFKVLYEILVEATISTAVVMFVVACAGLYSWLGATVGLIDKIATVLLAVSQNPAIIMLMINVILLVAGMLLDANSIMYIFLPILMPIIKHLGWDPIWFGIVMTVNLAIGQVTPPVAVNLFVGARISGLTMEAIAKPAIPLIVAAAIGLAILCVFEDIALVIPRALGMM